ncbi:hypothetical protein [Saliterribacillus persicus]|uniref:Uncharacterized protein n=1 Tax=Saliterribacillus persicus TaxID=930114 RepID=A0A368X9Z6_9BACI|nr:hypothetical protein [Saliterribacillus persicus]RCW64539.1 hypothetical protein DFR57_11322 [Saliterribacillus persicus]
MRSTKIMLLGIAIMIVALYITEVEGILNGDKEVFILVIGFFITIIGLLKKDKTE